MFFQFHTETGTGVTNASLMPTLPISCAWCLQEAGQEMGNGSHGICEAHAESLLAAWRARKRFSFSFSFSFNPKQEDL